MTNEDIRRRRAIMLYVPWPKLRILDTENTMWSDPSKAVVPFAIQISERGRRRRRRRTRMPPQRGEPSSSVRGITTRRFLFFDNRPSFEPSFVLFFVCFSFPLRRPLVIDLISSFCLGWYARFFISWQYICNIIARSILRWKDFRLCGNEGFDLVFFSFFLTSNLYNFLSVTNDNLALIAFLINR